MQAHRLHWQKQAYVFMEELPAMRMRLWRRCLWENLHLIQTSIAAIMGKAILTKTAIVGKISMAVRETGADADMRK